MSSEERLSRIKSLLVTQNNILRMLVDGTRKASIDTQYRWLSMTQKQLDKLYEGFVR